jgi:transposase InsO family protein
MTSCEISHVLAVIACDKREAFAQVSKATKQSMLRQTRRGLLSGVYHRARNELFEYLIYYNNHRPHQALGGKTPKDFALTKTKSSQSAN